MRSLRTLPPRQFWPLLLLLWPSLPAKGDDLPPEKFDQQSLALRTTLFHDPSLEQPLKSLVELYQKAGRTDELLGLYRNHVAQYPDDAGSNAVLVRLLLELKKPEATTVAQAAAVAHPEHAFTLFLRHLDLEAQRDPRSLDFLSQAIDKEVDPGKKRQWIDKLVAAALAEDRRELAEKHLRAQVDQPGQTPEALAALAQRMNRDRFSALALTAAEKGLAASPAPETSVELTLQAAAAESGLGKNDVAAARLDALLKRVAPDYARRAEIVSRRVALLRTDAEREAMLKTARGAWEAARTSEAAALDLVELLIACELRLEALKVLREAAQALPQSERLEKATLSLLDRLGDERGVRDYLQQRLAAQPNRPDLLYRLVRALFALGAKDEAAAKFDELLAKTDPADRTARRIDLARSLRRMSLPAEAVAQFQEALKADPKRLDVRRELAEALLSSGDPEAARRLVREAVSPDAEIENFLDVIGFMAQQGLWAEAREALKERQQRAPKDFEVAMRLVEALGQLGEQAEGEAALEHARSLADTDARYRRWLESGVAFAERVEAAEAFFDAEQARLSAEAAPDKGGWTTGLAARFLTLCEVARQGQGQPNLVPVLKEKLAEAATPPELRVALHRLLVEALGRDPKNAVEVQNHLEQLMAEDAARADEYRLRLAKAEHEALGQRGGQSDRVRAHLEATNVAAIADRSLLRGVDKLFLDYGFGDKAFAVLERVTELDPAEREPWQRWLTALAGAGDEERLREALRRVLAGVTKAPLNDETLELLRSHLVDSCWRSVAKLLADEDSSLAVAALPLLDVIERTKKLQQEQLWVTWARGMVLRKSGRPDAAAEAAVQLETLAATLFPPDAKDRTITFPDGLALAVPQALALLRQDAAPEPRTAPATAGPVRPPGMLWGFETDGAGVVQIVPAGPRVFIADDQGRLWVLDAATGKLMRRFDDLWTVASSAPVPAGRRISLSSSARIYTGNPNSLRPVAPRPAFAADGSTFFISTEGTLSARSADDGRVLWSAEVAGQWTRPAPPPGNPPAPTVVDETLVDAAGRVLVWRAEEAVAAAFHPETGKLLWTRDLSAANTNAYFNQLGTGSSCDGSRLLVFGHQPAILETASGATLWSFDSSAVRTFPIELRSTDDAQAAPAAPAVTWPASSVSRLSSGYFPPSYRSAMQQQRKLALSHLRPLTERSSSLSQWMAVGGSLVAPAVAWAETAPWGGGLNGELAGGRALLSGGNATQALSLAMPLAGQRLEAPGTFIGATGPRAVVLHNGGLVLCDTAAGNVTTLPLSGAAAGPSDAVVAGGRVYAATPEALVCVNTFTRRVLFTHPWPDAIKKWAGLDKPAAGAPVTAPQQAQQMDWGRNIQYQPRWMIVPLDANGSSVALRPRAAAQGDRLFLAFGNDKVAAFADASPQPAQ